MSWQTINWTERISERPWHGFLTPLTVEGIANAIYNILNGKLFTVAVCHDFLQQFYPSIEVVTRNKLRADWTDKSRHPIKWDKPNPLTAGEFSSIHFSGRHYHYIWNTRYDGHPCGEQRNIVAAPYFKLERGRFAVREIDYDGRLHYYAFEVEGDAPFDPFDCEAETLETLQSQRKILVGLLKELDEQITRKQ